MGSGGGTGLPFAAPSEVLRERLSLGGGGGKEPSMQGLELQLPGKAVINQRAETQDFSWRSRSFHLASRERPVRSQVNV